MTEARWVQQPGGLYLSVSPFDKNEAIQRDVAAEMMRGTVQTVAQTHGAKFDEVGFQRNMRALYSGDIQFEFYLAKWDICNPNPIYLGAALGWPTIGFDAQGNVGRGKHIEDVCLLINKMRQLVKAKPNGKEFPEESLLECFDRLSLQNMQARGEVYKFGEIDPHNLRALEPQLRNGGFVGKQGSSAVLEFEEIPSLTGLGLFDLPIIYQPKNLFVDEDLFFVPWQDDESDVRLIVTKGRATASGRPRVDIRTWRSGPAPTQETLRRVVASALFAIKNEVEDSHWSHQSPDMILSPSIPDGAPNRVANCALYKACNSEIIVPPSCRSAPSFGAPASGAHVYIVDDKAMLDAFTAIGAGRRLFGNSPMMPGGAVLRLGNSLGDQNLTGAYCPLCPRGSTP
ncbi:MAG: hypothetical protein KGI37_11140 [Alphaproteobacteria bacterium]|nr:hypothetical protein [Alphaproteobacteria bacterium]